ncbi:hypothetical protein Btru_029914 [Bulinus truncatus]|nr:hypothetical protein Btru_029914 [Bulinus truncatus]
MDIVGKGSKVKLLSETQVGRTSDTPNKPTRSKHRPFAHVETKYGSFDIDSPIPESNFPFKELTTSEHRRDSFPTASAMRRTGRRAENWCEKKGNKTQPSCVGSKDPPSLRDKSYSHADEADESDVNNHHVRGSDANNNSITERNSTAVRRSSGSPSDARRSSGRKKGKKKGKKGVTKKDPDKKSETVVASNETAEVKGSKAKDTKKKKVEKAEVSGKMSKSVSLLQARSSSVGRKKKFSAQRPSRKHSKYDFREAIRRIQKEVTHVFKVLDMENSGKISLGAVRVGVRALSLYPTEREMNELEDLMFEHEEAQEGALISLQSFLNVMTGAKLEHRYQPVSESELLMAFRTLDLKREGFLRGDELREIMMHEGEPMTDVEMRWMLENGMDDEGPRFNYKHYVTLMTRNVKQLPY